MLLGEDSTSIGSGGSLSDVDLAEVRALKDELSKLRQNESVYKSQIEVLTSSLALLPHPDDMKKMEDELRQEVKDLQQENESLLEINISMKLDISEVTSYTVLSAAYKIFIKFLHFNLREQNISQRCCKIISFSQIKNASNPKR